MGNIEGVPSLGVSVTTATLGSYQISGVLYVNIVREADTADEGLRELRPQQRLLGNELSESLDGKRILCADIDSTYMCRNTEHTMFM